MQEEKIFISMEEQQTKKFFDIGYQIFKNHHQMSFSDFQLHVARSLGYESYRIVPFQSSIWINLDELFEKFKLELLAETFFFEYDIDELPNIFVEAKKQGSFYPLIPTETEKPFVIIDWLKASMSRPKLGNNDRIKNSISSGYEEVFIIDQIVTFKDYLDLFDENMNDVFSVSEEYQAKEGIPNSNLSHESVVIKESVRYGVRCFSCRDKKLKLPEDLSCLTESFVTNTYQVVKDSSEDYLKAVAAELCALKYDTTSLCPHAAFEYIKKVQQSLPDTNVSKIY